MKKSKYAGGARGKVDRDTAYILPLTKLPHPFQFEAKLEGLERLTKPGDCICAWSGSSCKEPVTWKAIRSEVMDKFARHSMPRRRVQFLCEKHGNLAQERKDAWAERYRSITKA